MTYDPAKGSFLDGSTTDCETDDDHTSVDDGNGTLTISFSADFTDVSDVAVTCTFHLKSGQTVTADDPSRLTIKIDDLG